jgi:farnesyl diphosphate synthase
MDDALAPYLAFCQARVNARLDALLPSAEQSPSTLHSAMRYSALAAGKRIRPVLAYASAAALSVPAARVDNAAAAVELVHVYSLIHDDLPAMDDDVLRRGQPTCHVQFDEATAILAGDTLLTLAFQVLAEEDTHISAIQRIAMLQLLAKAAGSFGMAGGQALDLDANGKTLTLPELDTIHIHKTGALIRASVLLGALCKPDLDPAARQELDHYGKCIGLAFQIIDDILDVTADATTLGKTKGKDALQDKTTYPDLLGLRGARQHADDLIESACASLASFGANAQHLHAIARFITARTH